MKTRKLTKRVADAASYQGTGQSAFYLWDGVIAGFALRVYPSGRKSFVVTYRVRGKQRFYTIGRFGEMTVDQARAKALETLARARQGDDPSGIRIAGRQAPTVRDLYERYMREHSLPKKKPASIKVDRRIWNKMILPRFEHRKVADVDREDVAKMHAELAATPRLANVVRSTISAAFNFAEIWGWRREGSNPCRHVKRYKESSRERYLSGSELSRLGQVLCQEEAAAPYPVAALRLLILTGCRRSEIEKLKWDFVDLESKCLNLPDSKTGPKTVRLNSAAIAILSEIERVEGNPYVIVGRKEGDYCRSLTAFWPRIRKKANLEDLRIHDLRHTFASVGVNSGHSLPVIGKLLGHSKVATTERYAHLADQPIREAGEKIGQQISAALSGQE